MMNLMDVNYTMLATTSFGLEKVLADELQNLGAQHIVEGIRNVSFRGDDGFMYKANLALRTAIRILKPLQTFKVESEVDLIKCIQRIEWEKYLKVDGTFAINAVVNSKFFTSNSHYIALKSKDGVADYYRHKYHRRPNVDIKNPDLKIHIHIQHNQLTISLDTSGDSLHKRGYRTATNIAPINEVLAAGMLLLSGYNGTSHFIDPMCGSGTILIEAAMIAHNIPANINRHGFAFEKWADFDEKLFEIIKHSLLKKVRNTSFKIIGYDKAPSAVQKAIDNIENANLASFITVEQRNFFETEKPVEGPTTIMFNPPYGERLQIETAPFYKKIGDTLKNSYPDTTVWFITSDLEGLKHVGLRTAKKIPLKNGDLDCKFVRYDMYAGSKKQSN